MEVFPEGSLSLEPSLIRNDLNPSIGLRAGSWNDWNIGTVGTNLSDNVWNGAKRLTGWNECTSPRPAGQTVKHCHIHLIPRRAGDSVDPRRGVRGVIASKADYAGGG
jgi:hypothetical protein